MVAIPYEIFSTELDAAMQSHLEWTRRILRCAVLRTSPGPDVMAENAHTLCRFGIWFEKNRHIFDELDSKNAHALDINHRTMHEAIRQIAADVMENKPGDPVSLSTFETTQTLLIECLSKFKTMSNQLGSEVDPLTGLPLRHRLESNFQILAKRSNRHHGVLAVMLLDVDHFKSFNDQHGHAAGDVVLAELARCLKEVLRETDQAYRYGGEEFLVLLELHHNEGAEKASSHVLEAIRDLSVELPNGTQVKVTATIGVSLAVEGASMNDVIHQADMALYEGKRSGRNCIVVAPSRKFH